MSDGAELFFRLSAAQRRAVQDVLVEHALARWKAFAQEEGPIRYWETVCGTPHTLDANLPGDAIAAVRSGEGAASVAERYLEPIAAMQDDDVRLPEAVEFAYYAVYNYFRRYAMQQELDDWLLVNQALSSDPDEHAWAAVLSRAIEGAI